MEEKSVYEILKEQIEKDNKIINKLIKIISVLSIVSVISIALGIGIPFYAHVHGYFWSNYTDKSDSSISGDNNTNTSNNELSEKSSIDTDN